MQNNSTRKKMSSHAGSGPGMEISRKWEISRIFPGIQEKIDQANRNTKGSVSAVLVIVKL